MGSSMHDTLAQAAEYATAINTGAMAKEMTQQGIKGYRPVSLSAQITALEKAA